MCSVCLKVGPLSRNIFFLPRAKRLASAKDENSVTSEAVTMKAVYEEVKLLLGAMGITKFQSKPTTKKYCFEQEKSEDGKPRSCTLVLYTPHFLCSLLSALCYL